MDVLVLGGTSFVGRHIAVAALARGHRLSLFHRGRTGADLFPVAEHLRGDRLIDAAALEGKRWDAVIDVSAYVPRAVRTTGAILSKAAPHCTFISTISVYADVGEEGPAEDAPLATLADPASEDVSGANYGGLKVLCEREAERHWPGRTLVIRPGLVAGPHDPTDRFTYWVRRITRPGPVLGPGDPAGPVQFIDARDLAEWTVRMTEAAATGTFNAVGPGEPATMADLLAACGRAAGKMPETVWLPEAFLLAQGVRPYADLPLWLPRTAAGFARVSSARAVAAGLTHRSPDVTARDTLEWDAGRDAETPLANGLSPEREAALLAAYRSQPVHN